LDYLHISFKLFKSIQLSLFKLNCLFEFFFFIIYLKISICFFFYSIHFQIKTYRNFSLFLFKNSISTQCNLYFNFYVLIIIIHYFFYVLVIFKLKNNKHSKKKKKSFNLLLTKIIFLIYLLKT